MRKLIKIVPLWMMVLFSAQISTAQKVIELRKPELNKVVVKLMFNVGSVADPEGKEGLTALTANLITEGGTATMTKAQIDDMVYPMAANYGGSVDKESTVFTFEVPVDYIDQFYPVISGLILTPTFNQSDFERVKAQQLNYVTRGVRHSSDENYSKFVLEHILYRGTPYQHMVAGNEAGVNNVNLEDIQAHYKKYFTQNNLMIGIAGNYSEDFKERLVNDLKKLPASGANIPKVQNPAITPGIDVEIIAKPGAFGSAIFMGYPININRASEDWPALMIANSYLGEHRKSYGILYQKIRETRSMNYGDYSYIEWYPSGSSNLLPIAGYPRSTNYFALWIRPVQLGSGLKEQYPELKDIKQGHAHFAIRMALYQLDNLIRNGIPEEEFELTKSFLRSYKNLYIKDPSQQLGYLMDSKFYGIEDYISELDDRLEDVTLEDVNEAVRKYLQTDNMKIAIITSPDEAEVLAESLKSNQPSPMSYSNIVKEGLGSEIFAEDKKVEVFPLKIKSVKIIKSEDTFK